ncbi:MAG: hypothetical protein VX335_03810 [Pseudomonadota bacterium]|nr:hypothetical protein [Pseudomonadota bacterium]
MTYKLKNQQGSFFAEVGAVIASISILTLISTNYIDSMAGRAQVSEAFVLMNPIVENVNSFYSKNGIIGGSSGNYTTMDVYDNATGTPQDYAGRFVEEAQSFSNGVVYAKMNGQFSDSTFANNTVGKVSNVQEAIQGEYIFLVPFLIGDTYVQSTSTSGTGDGAVTTTTTEIDTNQATTLRWGCLTTINAKPPTGEVIAPLAKSTATGDAPSNAVINEQYYYAPGCVVITRDQAECLNPADAASFGGAQCTNPGSLQGPVNWNTPYTDIVGG